MNDTSDPPLTAAESGAAMRARRAERQRQSRLLQLEEQIGDAKGRVELAQGRLDNAVERLEALEAALAEVQAEAPLPEDGES